MYNIYIFHKFEFRHQYKIKNIAMKRTEDSNYAQQSIFRQKTTLFVLI